MKKNTYLFIIAILCASCKTQSNIVTSKKIATNKGIYAYSEKGIVQNVNSKKNATSISNENSAFQIVTTAISHLGVKYKTGGTTKDGMDCSGLVYNTFKQYNIILPRTAVTLANEGNAILKEDAKPGDLIFFKTNTGNSINHVGIITEITPNEIKFIHASVSKGVIISSTNETYYGSALIQINRLIK